MFRLSQRSEAAGSSPIHCRLNFSRLVSIANRSAGGEKGDEMVEFLVTL